MRFTPRGVEIEEIASILRSDKYDTPESMAEAVLLKVVDLLWFRDWWILAARTDGARATFGPFASEAEAMALGNKLNGILVPTDKWGVVFVKGLGQTADERAGGGFGYCVVDECGHPAYAHSMSGTSRGKCVLCLACDKYEQATKKRATKKKNAP